MSSISSSCILISLNLRLWEAVKLDKGLTQQVNHDAGAQEGVARVRKSLLPNVPQHLAIKKIAGSARNYLHGIALPWAEGLRICHVIKWQQVVKPALDQYEQDFDAAVLDFLRVYPHLISAQKFALGSLFDPNEYLSVDQVAAKYSFRVQYLPVPEAGDFRVDLENEGLNDLRENLRREQDRQVQDLMASVRDKLLEQLRFTVQRLGHDPETGEPRRFMGTLIPNLANAIADVRAMNITRDQALDQLCDKAERVIHGIGTEHVKQDPTLREHVKTQLAEAASAFDF
jgi:hypothetical protein